MSVSDLEKLKQLQTAVTLLRGDLARAYKEACQNERQIISGSIEHRGLLSAASALAGCIDRLDVLRHENNIEHWTW